MSRSITNHQLYSSIREVLEQARSKAYRAINSAMVQAYWEVGRLIVEDEQKGEHRAEYGKQILKELSANLTRDFGKGFDERNLRNFRQFYLTFPIRNALRSELTWTHYRLLLKVENEQARQYYIEQTIENNWSSRALERQINSFYYERLLSSRNDASVQKEMEVNTQPLQPFDFIKDPYVLEFLSLPSNAGYKEKDIEEGLINQLQKFLLELGTGFAFVGRQKHIRTESSNFYIDLVFYHFKLKCFVLIDLELGKLTHQDIGQMDMYVRLYNDLEKSKDDNPTVGLILCSEKEETVVKYSVLSENKQLFASQYMMYLPTEQQLKEVIEQDRFLIEQNQKDHA